MTRTTLLKLLTLAVVAAMLLSTFAACTPEVQEEVTTEAPTEAPTEKPTEAPTTEETTEEPTGEEPTGEEPTGEEPTGEEPTGEEPTGEEPTTEAPTDEPTTEAPTNEPTEEPTTEEPTEEPTEAPTTEKPTEAPTEEPKSEMPEYTNGALFIGPELLGQDIDLDIDWAIDEDYIEITDEALSIMFYTEPATYTFIANYLNAGVLTEKGEPINIGDAKYMLIKYRVSEGVGSVSVSVNSEGFENANTVSLPTVLNEEDEWNVAIIDMLYCLSPNYLPGKAIQTIAFNATFNGDSFEDAILEIAGVGFFKDFDAITENIDDERATYFIKSGKSAYVTIENQKCVECGDWVIETRETVDGRIVMTYNCAVCGEELMTKSYSEDILFFMGSTLPYKFEGTANADVMTDADRVFAYNRYIINTPAQAFMNILDIDDEITTNVKRYIVLKARFIGESSYNGSPWFAARVNNNVEPFMDGASINNFNNNGKYNSGMNIQGGMKNSESWRVIVFDLFIEGSPFSAEDALTAINFHFERLPAGSIVDIAVIANCSNWNEIDDIIDEETVELLSGSDGFGAKVSIAEQAAKIQGIKETVDEITDANSGEVVEYKYTYEYKGEIISTKTVPASVNMYLTPGSLARIDDDIIAEGDEEKLIYRQFSSVGQNGFGNSLASNMPYEAGRYLVIKMRGISAGWFALYINGCPVYGYTLVNWSGHGIDKWNVFVYDLESDLYKNEDGTRYVGKDIPITSIRGSQGASNFDVAYIAICDSWAEIDAVVSEEKVMLMSSTLKGDLQSPNVTIANKVSAESTAGGDLPAEEFTTAAPVETVETESTIAVTEVVEGNTYTYVDENGETVATKTISADVATYISAGTFKPLDKGAQSQGLLVESDGENLFAYERFKIPTGDGTNGVIRFALADDNIADLDGGRYFVLKIRFTPQWTTTYGGLYYTVTGGEEVAYGGGYDTFYKNNGVWKTVVFDLGADVTGKSIESLRINWNNQNWGATIDIAYAAFCDTWEQIDNVVDEADVIMAPCNGGNAWAGESSVKNIATEIEAEKAAANEQ